MQFCDKIAYVWGLGCPSLSWIANHKILHLLANMQTNITLYGLFVSLHCPLLAGVGREQMQCTDPTLTLKQKYDLFRGSLANKYWCTTRAAAASSLTIWSNQFLCSLFGTATITNSPVSRICLAGNAFKWVFFFAISGDVGDGGGRRRIMLPSSCTPV